MSISVLYVSSRDGLTYCSDQRPPRKHDVFYDKQQQQLRQHDGRKWRALCRVCPQQGKPTYCLSHNPNHVSGHLKGGVSAGACEYMDVMEKEFNTTVIHRHIDAYGGWIDQEWQIKDKYTGKSIKVDGYVPDHKTVIEYLGDYWHGNLERYAPHQIHKSASCTMLDLHEKTMKRLHRIASLGYHVVYVWEWDWKHRRKDQNPLEVAHIILSNDRSLSPPFMSNIISGVTSGRPEKVKPTPAPTPAVAPVAAASKTDLWAAEALLQLCHQNPPFEPPADGVSTQSGPSATPRTEEAPPLQS